MLNHIQIFTSRALYSRALVLACIGYIFGIALYYIFSFSQLFIPLGLSALFFIAVFFMREEKQAIIFCVSILLLFCAAGAGYGAWRMNRQFDNSDIGFYDSSQGVKVTIDGVIAGSPEVTSKNTKAVVGARAITLDGGEPHNVHGSIEAFFPPRTEIQEGQRLVVAGTLQKPENFSGFDYEAYLSARGIEALLMHAHIIEDREVSEASLGSWLGSLASLRMEAKNLVLHSIPGSEGKIIAALTLGYGNELSQSLSDTLSLAGIRYLMAISGLHIMVIAQALMVLMLTWGLSRRTALLSSFTAIFLFGAFIAFPLPAVRAIVMAGVFYAGQALGRPLNIFRTLLYAGSGMLVVNPALFADVGFQLSFMGLLGILLLAPFFENIFRKALVQTGGSSVTGQIGKEPGMRGKLHAFLVSRNMLGLLAMSLAATLFTFPLTLFHFGVASLWGVVMSICVIPLLGPLFLLVCALLIFGSIAPIVSVTAAFPLWVGARIFLQAARFFSSLSFFIFSATPYNPALLLGGYAVIACFFLVIVRRGYNPLQASIRFFRFDET